MSEKKEYNIIKAILAQKKYCKTLGFMHFAPEDGCCYKCGKNIYAEKGISVDLAGRHLVTGCPHCNTSFID